MVDYVELLCLRGVGKLKHAWQDRDYVLSWFWRKEGEAIFSGFTFGPRPVRDTCLPEPLPVPPARQTGRRRQVFSCNLCSASSSTNRSTTLAIPSKSSLMPIVKSPDFLFSVPYLPGCHQAGRRNREGVGGNLYSSRFPPFGVC